MALGGVGLLLIRAAAWAAGVDAWTSVISGTPPPGVSLPLAAGATVALVALQLAAVLVAPVLLLAAAVLAAMDRGPRSDAARARR